jgi:hypothetical protein
MTSDEYQKRKRQVHPLAEFLANAEEIIHEANARKQTLSSGLVAEAVEETTRTQGVENDEAKPLP